LNIGFNVENQGEHYGTGTCGVDCSDATTLVEGGVVVFRLKGFHVEKSNRNVRKGAKHETFTM
jgi:hypothetical protein